MLRLGLSHVLCGALIVVAGFACGDDDDGGDHDGGLDAGDPRDSGGAGMDGSTAGRGGGSGMGVAGSPVPDAGDPYTCEPPAPEEGGSADEGESCCGGLGRCSRNVSGPGTASYGLDECTDGQDLKCVPLEMEASQDAGADDDAGASAQLASCRMTLGSTAGQDFEGRCIPSCFLSGQASANLMQSTCEASERCVPCYSPITGESTGACNRPGDAPVEAAPAGFAECGEENIGYCVPAGAGSGSGAMLPQLTCGDDQVCAPKLRVLDQSACFARCQSLGPGACVAKFVIDPQFQSILPMSTCMPGELCAPCVNPTSGMPTGACR